MDRDALVNQLQHKASRYRMDIIEMLTEAGSGHPGGSLSAIDLVSAPLPRHSCATGPSEPAVARARPPGAVQGPRRAGAVRGDGRPGLLSRASSCGRCASSARRCRGTPASTGCPGIDASTGSLGQGLSIAQGMALAARLDGEPLPRLLPDGRRRDPGGPGLGGGDVERPSSASTT